MIAFYNSKLSKLLSLVVIISFINLLYPDCSKNESPTEPDQTNEITVDSNGSASISTNSAGKASIISQTFDRIDFEIKNSNYENLKNINISYHEDNEKCFIEVSDPTDKYAKFIFWGDLNDFNNSNPNIGLAKVNAIQKSNIAITLVIVLVATVASTIYASYSAYKAFKEINEFWVTDKIIDEFGEEANIKTMGQIMDYIKSKISATTAIITIGLNVFTLGTASAATLPAQGAIQAKNAVGSFTIGVLTDFALAWYNNNRKEKWGEAAVNTMFIVREFTGEKCEDEYGLEKFLGLDIEPYIDSSETGAVTDIDGNMYKTVKIGNQWWMAENLKVTHYSNGDAIPNVTNGSTWTSLTTGAYCNYDNDENNVATYGRLYNWYSVVDSRKIAPTGWHVPSKAEWQTLVNHLGGEAIAGGKMKEIGTVHWASPNTGATNESGFTALPGGYCDQTFYHLGTHTYFWSSTQSSSSDAWHRYLLYRFEQIPSVTYPKKFGFSVRCVRD